MAACSGKPSRVACADSRNSNGSSLSHISDSDPANPYAHRSVILLGKTGTGKSSLANLLVDDLECNTFPIGHYSTSETQFVSSRYFEIHGDKFEVYDTCGFCDESLNQDEILRRLRDVTQIYAHIYGISQIFFVLPGRICEQDYDVFQMLRQIFDQDVYKYVTIVRTHFPRFHDIDMCNRDRDSMEKNRYGAKILEQVTRHGVIHVDVPDKGPFEVDEHLYKRWKERRLGARSSLIAHLEKCRGHYLPHFIPSKFDNFVQDTIVEAQREALLRQVRAMKMVNAKVRADRERLEESNRRLSEALRRTQDSHREERAKTKTENDDLREKMKTENDDLRAKLANAEKNRCYFVEPSVNQESIPLSLSRESLVPPILWLRSYIVWTSVGLP